MLSPSPLITSPARASWGFGLIRDAWGLCLHCADERSAVKRQNHAETKGFFLLCSHIGAISKTAVPLPGVPNSLTWSLPLYPIYPSFLLIYENIKRERKGPTKVVHRRGEPLSVYPVLGRPDATSRSDNWDSGPEDALLSQVPRLIRAEDFSAPADLTLWWAGLCVMKGCKSQWCAAAAACGFVLKGRGHSNYRLCHQSMMKVLLAWRACCSNMRLRHSKPAW